MTNIAITHSAYRDGAVQSLGFVDAKGQSASIGVVAPGEYTFDPEKRESIAVLSGELIINGVSYTPSDTLRGKRCVIEMGQKFTLVAKQISTYVCEYGVLRL